MTIERKSDPVAEAVATLIHAAGRREDPPREAYDIVLAAAERTWQGKVRRRQQWRIAGGLAAAVVLATAAAALLRTLLPMTESVEVARVDRIIGEVEVRPPGARSWLPISDQAAAIHDGAHVRTSESGVAGLALAGGVSLRLASLTEVELGDDSRVRLTHGAVYADTGPGDAGTISVITPAGTAHDFGTQFEVRYQHERLQLRVREGRVALLRDTGQLVADAGTQLAVDAAGEVSRVAIAPDDPAWRWAESVAPVPDLDDQPVTVLLDWVARETGRALRYASAEVERQAATTILHGKIGQLAPLEALDAMLATTDLAYEVREDGTIEIRHK